MITEHLIVYTVMLHPLDAMAVQSLSDAKCQYIILYYSAGINYYDCMICMALHIIINRLLKSRMHSDSDYETQYLTQRPGSHWSNSQNIRRGHLGTKHLTVVDITQFLNFTNHHSTTVCN